MMKSLIQSIFILYIVQTVNYPIGQLMPTILDTLIFLIVVIQFAYSE